MALLPAQEIRRLCDLKVLLATASGYDLDTIGRRLHIDRAPGQADSHYRNICFKDGYFRPMLDPFEERSLFEGRSYGLSHATYDVRIAETIWVWPLWGRLASTIERFDMPHDVAARVHDKSSWARKFVTMQNTFIDPGWRGFLTLEITRHRPWPVRIKKGTPIAQIAFEPLTSATDSPYFGKYQDQEAGPQPARMEKSDV